MKRHGFDATSLVAGLVFLAVAAVYLVGVVADVSVDGRWVLPLALIGLGVAGIAGALTTATRHGRDDDGR